MDFSNLPNTAEADRILKEIKDVATIDELFGGPSGTGEKKPPYYPLNNKGDALVGVIVGEPEMVQTYGYQTNKKKFFVKDETGKWSLKLEGEFDASLEHSPVKKIVVVVRDADGKEWRIDFNTKQEREALKDEMQATGLPLVEGVTIGKKVADRQGNNKTVVVKLKAAE